jgi:wyosine [tRNA(Phe)-imidazoG37] synthetase (radical SAM superfamily)
MMTKYTISDISATLSVTERTVQRWIETLVIKEGNKILVPEDVLELLKSRHVNDKVATSPDIEEKQFDRVEYFTEEEYQEFHKRLVEYDILKDQLQYHRKSSESHNKQMEMILQMMEQRNYIEAKEKKLDR